MANWTVKQVTRWLRENGFEKQVKNFKEKKIDGRTLLRLTNDDISQLFVEEIDGRMIREAPVGVKSRFRLLLREWRMNNQELTNLNESSICVTNEMSQTINTTTIEQEEKPVETKPAVKREVMYSIDREIELEFFKNERFIIYFNEFTKREIPSVDIQVQKSDDSSMNYTIKFIGTKEDIRIARRFVRQLLQSIQYQIYTPKNWNCRRRPREIIQNVLDNQPGLFTVCQLEDQTLKIFFVDDDKFNPLNNRTRIDEIIQMDIIQEKIRWIKRDNRHMIEHRSWKFQICPTEAFSRDFERIQNDLKQLHTFISIDVHLPSIELFGAKETVNNALEQFRDLFARYQLKTFRLNQFSSTERDCLVNLRWKDVYDYARQFEKYNVRIDVEKNQFEAPECLKDQIRSSLKDLLKNLKSKDFQNLDFYFNLADQVSQDLKNIARRARCYCETIQTKKRKSYPIPRGHGTISHLPKTILEQANQFTASPSVCTRTKFDRSSIALFMGDIAAQKADVLIIPSTYFGLRESLIERAGSIVEKPSSNPLIIETTGGDLNCQKILFVNWSLPTMVDNDDILSESIRLFVSKSIEYVKGDVKSIAFAIPDWCEEQEILAEEMLEQTIDQIKSTALKVAFVFQLDQSMLYQRFVNTLQKLRQSENHFGEFYCPISTLTIRLMSFDEDNLSKCEQRINGYLNRAIFKMKLNGFEHWNQNLINAFYKYATDRSVLPRIDSQQQIVLYGPVSQVYEVNEKHQFTNAYIQQKMHLPVGFLTKTSSKNYHVCFSYAEEDSNIAHRLANRLLEEGFTVWIESMGFEKIAKKIRRSDCVIVCLSENYFRNSRCEQEANYIEQIGKPLIPVKVEYFQPIDWLMKFIEKESIFHLFGSDNQFNFEYEKIVLKIFQLIKPEESTPAKDDLRLICLLTPEQKQLKYEKMIKSSKGKLTDDEKQNLSAKVQDLLELLAQRCQERASQYSCYFTSFDHEEKEKFYLQSIQLDVGIFTLKQWLEKLPTKFNIPPFTFTGDVNDAIFPLLNAVLHHPNLLSIFRKHYYIKIDRDESPVVIHSMKRAPKRIRKDAESVVKRFLSRSKLKKKEEYRPRKFNWKPPVGKGRYTENERTEYRARFAEQMQKTNEQFENFCEEYQDAPRSMGQENLLAIFGFCPFPPVLIESSKRKITEPTKNLPLKFLWNGISETDICTVKWRTSSSLFFFESQSIAKH